MTRSCKVAVIGAGVAGLCAARELLLESHAVTVFERSNRVGGTWIYDPEIESDPLGIDPTRKIVHSSLYRSLRTNLPRPLMSFSDYPFTTKCFGDSRYFPGHEEVAAFLKAFAKDEGVYGLVRFETEVVRVRMGRKKNEWAVEVRREREEELEVHVFEAVVVCNGHFTQPSVADIRGIDKWPGKQIHCHNYRDPEPFAHQIAVIIGNGPSAQDIFREVSKVAKEVHLASRSPNIEVGKLDGYDNVWQHSMINYVNENGEVVFDDGSSLLADIILHCTGYKYNFPFLDTKETVSIDDNRVGPLYKHVFPPHLAPWLCFVGLLSKSMIFTTIELQSKWVARVLSGKIALPSEEDMVASVNGYYRQMEEMGTPKHFTHSIYPDVVRKHPLSLVNLQITLFIHASSYSIYDSINSLASDTQVLGSDFLNWMAAEVGIPPLEDWRIELYNTIIRSFLSPDGRYRDGIDADYWMQQSQLAPQRTLSSE